MGAFVEKVGGKTGYAGPVIGLLLGEIDMLWDVVALAQYPSLAAMMAMVQDPGYQEIAKHRTAGLAGQLNIKTKGTLVWITSCSFLTGSTIRHLTRSKGWRFIRRGFGLAAPT